MAYKKTPSNTPMAPTVEPPGHKPPTSAEELLERLSILGGGQINEADLIQSIAIGDLVDCQKVVLLPDPTLGLDHAIQDGADRMSPASRSLLLPLYLDPELLHLAKALVAMSNSGGGEVVVGLPDGLTMVGSPGIPTHHHLLIVTRLLEAIDECSELPVSLIRHRWFLLHSDKGVLYIRVLGSRPVAWLEAPASEFDPMARFRDEKATREPIEFDSKYYLRVGQGYRPFRPEDFADLPRSAGEGLTLYFNTLLTPFDRFLVDGVIFGVLGRDTDCRVVQYEERGNTAIVRLQAARQADLEAVAEALWERVWEQQRQTQQAALVKLVDGLLLQLQPGLSELRHKLDRIELHLPGEDAVERLNDLGEEHVRQKDQKVVRTWQEKLVRAVGKKVAAKVGEEVVDAAADAMRGLLSGSGGKPG